MQNENLQWYRGRLLQMESRLTRTVNELGDRIREDVVAPGDVSSVPTHPGDMDVADLDRELAAAQNQSHLLGQVAEALKRIDAGTFGRCQRCGKEIGRERLEAIPYTRYCVRCAEAVESEEESAAEGAPRGPTTTP